MFHFTTESKQFPGESRPRVRLCVQAIAGILIDIANAKPERAQSLLKTALQYCKHATELLDNIPVSATPRASEGKS